MPTTGHVSNFIQLHILTVPSHRTHMSGGTRGETMAEATEYAEHSLSRESTSSSAATVRRRNARSVILHHRNVQAWLESRGVLFVNAMLNARFPSRLSLERQNAEALLVQMSNCATERIASRKLYRSTIKCRLIRCNAHASEERCQRPFQWIDMTMCRQYQCAYLCTNRFNDFFSSSYISSSLGSSLSPSVPSFSSTTVSATAGPVQASPGAEA